MITVKIVSLEDDLAQIVEEINLASWDEADEMSEYDAESLAAYLKRQDTLFVVCHFVTREVATFMGMASSRMELKPYRNDTWLYVDEVDVCPKQRRKGAGKAMMTTLIDFAASNGCEEVWLGTELDNMPANLLYQSLQPDDVSQVVGYTYETDE